MLMLLGIYIFWDQNPWCPENILAIVVLNVGDSIEEEVDTAIITGTG